MTMIFGKRGEERVVGREIVPEKQRAGALGKLDRLSLSEFKRLPLWLGKELLDDARTQKREMARAFEEEADCYVRRLMSDDGAFPRTHPPLLLKGRADVCTIKYLEMKGNRLGKTSIYMVWKENGHLRCGLVFEAPKGFFVAVKELVEKPDAIDISLEHDIGSSEFKKISFSKKEIGLDG